MRKWAFTRQEKPQSAFFDNLYRSRKQADGDFDERFVVEVYRAEAGIQIRKKVGPNAPTLTSQEITFWKVLGHFMLRFTLHLIPYK